MRLQRASQQSQRAQRGCLRRASASRWEEGLARRCFQAAQPGCCSLAGSTLGAQARRLHLQARQQAPAACITQRQHERVRDARPRTCRLIGAHSNQRRDTAAWAHSKLIVPYDCVVLRPPPVGAASESPGVGHGVWPATMAPAPDYVAEMGAAAPPSRQPSLPAKCSAPLPGARRALQAVPHQLQQRLRPRRQAQIHGHAGAWWRRGVAKPLFTHWLKRLLANRSKRSPTASAARWTLSWTTWPACVGAPSCVQCDGAHAVSALCSLTPKVTWALL